MSPLTTECVPYYEDADRLTGQCTAAVSGKRFVTASANFVSGPLIPATAQVGSSDPTDGGNIQIAHSAPQGPILGASGWDGAVGEKIPVICEGVVPITAAANIAAGARVEVGANGQAQTITTGVFAGLCLNGCLAGADAMIKLP